MNDRFKFRVWDKDQKIMKECTQITLDKEQKGSMCDVKGKVTTHLIYQPHYILMQCTGLKDKNSKLIYEGDIVQILGDEIPYIIEYEQDRAMFIIHSEIDRVCCNFDNYSGSELEVIGNIYENKELLESEER